MMIWTYTPLMYMYTVKPSKEAAELLSFNSTNLITHNIHNFAYGIDTTVWYSFLLIHSNCNICIVQGIYGSYY